MATKHQIETVLCGLPKWRGQPTAFENIIFKACADATHYDAVAEIIERLGREGKLMTYPSYLEAFRDVFPEFAIQDNEATREVVVDRLIQLGLPNTATAVRAVIPELLRNGKINHTSEFLSEQADIQRRTDAAANEARETLRMVDEILHYMLNENGKVRREYTQRQFNEKQAGLQALPFDQLVTRYNEVMTHRAQRKSSVEELRSTVRTDATRQRQALYSRYERIPDHYRVPGKDVDVPWSFNLFKRLPTTEQRRLLDHYGDQQITAACAASGRN
jgi:hypothetical protein